MRWDRLFDDLEAQLEYGLDSEESLEAGEYERWRLGRLTLRDRLLAASLADRRVSVRLVDRTVLAVQPKTVGADWFAARTSAHGTGGTGGTAVIMMAGIDAIILDQNDADWSIAAAEPPASASAPRVTTTIVLRDLCRRRVAVRLRTRDGHTHGTIDRVGADHLDLAVHEPGSVRRAVNVSALSLVPLSRVICVEF